VRRRSRTRHGPSFSRCGRWPWCRLQKGPDVILLDLLLDLLAGLLEVALRLVRTALGFELLVIGGAPDAFLALPADLVRVVVDLVVDPSRLALVAATRFPPLGCANRAGRVS
jgi:hypothetical protein